MIQRLLSKSLLEKLEIARVFRDVTSEDHMKAINNFLNYGISVGVEVFHAMFFYTLELLAPTYKRFYYGYYGSIVRDNAVESASQVYFASASIIQCAWRGKFIRNKVKKGVLIKIDPKRKSIRKF